MDSHVLESPLLRSSPPSVKVGRPRTLGRRLRDPMLQPLESTGPADSAFKGASWEFLPKWTRSRSPATTRTIPHRTTALRYSQFVTLARPGPQIPEYARRNRVLAS